MPEVSVPLLGKGFDGQSAHDFRLKPTIPGASCRYLLQLRPGEPFYIQDLSFTLVPEEERNHPAHLASAGAVPSYEEYSQHVSQGMEDSQALCFLSPSRSGRATSAPLESPLKAKRMTPARTSLIQHVAASVMDGKNDSKKWPQTPARRNVLQPLREIQETGKHDIRKVVNQATGVPLQTEPPIIFSRAEDPEKELQVLDLGGENPLECKSSIPSAAGVQECELQVVLNSTTDDTQGSTEPQTSDSPKLQAPLAPKAKRVHNLEREPQQPQVIIVKPFCNSDPATRTSEDEMEHDEPPNKRRRKLSRNQSRIPTEKRQDSLIGKTTNAAAPRDIAAISRRSQNKTPSLSVSVSASASASASKPSDGTNESNPQTPTVLRSFLASRTNSTEPTNSLRSTRFSSRDHSHHPNTQTPNIRVLFANSTSVDTPTFKRFLTDHGVKIVQKCKDATCLCVGKGELKKTPKLILAVAMGLEIIREDWVTDSARSKKLQDTAAYTARDPPREQEWGINLADAIERGRQKVQVFRGWTITFTPSMKKELGKSFAELKEIVFYAGAVEVNSVLPRARKGGEDAETDSPPSSTKTLIIATQADTSLPALKSYRYYTKDILILSILRGKLELESDEFQLREGADPSTSTGENKKRKR